MKIYRKSDKRVLAELDKSDIEKYNIDFNRLSLDDGATQRLINDVALMSDMDFGKKSRLYIDTFALNESCIFLAITLVSRLKHYRLRQKNICVACRLFDPNQLYRLCEAVYPYLKSISSSLLFYDGKTYTVLLSLDSSQLKQVKNAVSVFGKPYKVGNEFEKALIAEHNSLICADFIQTLLL